MAKAASGIPVLRESILRVLWVFFPVCGLDERYASLRADPRADSAACALLHVEDVSPPEPFGEQYFLVGIFHGESSFEDVPDSFVHRFKDHVGPSLPVCL
jgi:alpha-D-ribose 1-methylphosphonate 5-triphosphate synthase subunit PhnL